MAEFRFELEFEFDWRPAASNNCESLCLFSLAAARLLRLISCRPPVRPAFGSPLKRNKRSTKSIMAAARRLVHLKSRAMLPVTTDGRVRVKTHTAAWPLWE